jgi:hypothetical protein
MVQRSVVTVGDTIRLSARIYNFSVADMPAGSTAHAQFFGQKYDQATGQLDGDAFFIGQSSVDAIPGFKSPSNEGTRPNWKMTSTTFNTANFSGKYLVFWVVVWGEDSQKNLLQELQGHGLTRNPSGMSFKQITDVPFESYSNNVGLYGTYSPLFVAPVNTPSVSGTTPALGDTRLLQANDVLVEATPTKAGEHSIMTVTIHNTTGGDFHSEPIVFYDGDPSGEGKPFDVQHIPFLAAGDTYIMHTNFQPETSGNHNIYVRVGSEAAVPSSLALTTLTVQ